MTEGGHRLTLMGPFRWISSSGERVTVQSKKGMALIALLATSQNGEHSRAWLQERLWGSRDPAQGSASLRRELSNLRRLLNGDGGTPMLHADAHVVRLDLSRLRVDVRDFSSRQASAWLGKPGEFLEGLDVAGEEGFEDWLRLQRRDFAELLESVRETAWRDHALDKGRDPPVLDPLQLAAGDDPPIPIQPSVAVLPLRSIGGDGHLAQGLSEQISLTLASWPTLFVVSSGTLKPDSASLGQICRQLGVRYLIDGVVREAGGNARISVRLHDGAQGRQLWAQQFDAPAERIFEVQDLVAETVAPLIDSALEKHTRTHQARATGRIDASRLYWQANQIAREWHPNSLREAIALLDRALLTDPENSWVASLAALCHAVCLGQRWGGDEATMDRLIAIALRTGSDDAYVLGHLAGALLAPGHNPADAEILVQRALAMNPRMPATLFFAGWISLGCGRPEQAIERFTLALRVNPKMAMRAYVMTGLALAFLAGGRIEEARALAHEAVQQLPGFAPAILIAATCEPEPFDADVARMWQDRFRKAGGFEAAFAVIRDPRARAMLAGRGADILPTPALGTEGTQATGTAARPIVAK